MTSIGSDLITGFSHFPPVALSGFLKDYLPALSMYQTLMKELDPGTKRTETIQQMVILLKSQQLLTPDQQELLLSGLQELLHADNIDASDTELEELTNNYLKLVRKNKQEQLDSECSQLIKHFPTLSAPREVKLLLLLDQQMGKVQKDNEKTKKMEEIEDLISTLTEQRKSLNSAELILAQGYLALNKDSATIALDYLKKGVNVKPDLFCGHFYLAQCLHKLHEDVSCLKTCNDALTLLSKKSRIVTTNINDAVQHLFLLAAHCCYQQGTKYSLAQSLEYLDKLTEDTEETLVLRAYIMLSLGDSDELKACIEKLETSNSTEVRALQSWIAFKNKEYTAAVTGLEKCVAEDPNNALYLLRLGCALWELRNTSQTDRLQDRCFNLLLKAAKLDPYQSHTFLYLGHFYRELKNDQQRARKCYQKAFALNSNNEEAGAALCDMMAESGEEDNVKTLLENVTATAAAGCSKWAWLRLGLSQVRTGDSTNAIASFQSALRADPSDDFIQTLLTVFVSLGETYLLMSRRFLDQCLTGLALDHCQQAITCLTRAATQRPDLSCLWKLLGDCCTLLQGVNSRTFSICVPRRLCQATSADDKDVISIGKLEMLELATKCYGKALKILPENSSLWHDFGISFYYQCCQLKSSSEAKLLVEKSISVLKKAVSLEPTDPTHWTALGVVAASRYAKNYSLAQHCFIKSIECESNNAVAWTNLGTVYLQNDNFKLAHEAFKVAQNQNPEYITSWIGQGLIGEIVAHEDAMDLFRHTTDIGVHMESCIGYGHWVITTLLDVTNQHTPAFQYCIKQMAAIPVAVTALTRFTRLNESDPWAHNMLALLLEHQGLLVSAEDSLHKAVELLKESGIAEVKCHQSQTEFSQVAKECEKSATFTDLCQFGLLLYCAGKLTDSYRVYQLALSMATSDTDKSDVYAALGMVAFKCQDLNGAKTALFTGYQICPSSVRGLLALCALGMVQMDLDLIEATLKELSDLDGAGEAVAYVQQLLQQHQGLAGLWLLAARVAFQHLKDGALALTFTKEAVSRGSPNHQDALQCLSMAQLQLGKHNIRKAHENALSAAQKAYHINPDSVSNTCLLVSALHGKAVIQHVMRGETTLIDYERRLLDQVLTSPDLSPALMCWCLKQKSVAQILTMDMSGVLETIRKISENFPEEQLYSSVLECVVNNKHNELEALVLRNDSDFFFWQILLKGLVNEEKYSEAGILMRQALQKARGESNLQVKQVCVAYIAWLAAQQLLVDSGKKGHIDEEALNAELEEAVQTIAQLSDQPYTAMQLLQALVHITDNQRQGKKKQKHHFANVLQPGLPLSNLEIEVSLARRGVIYFLHTTRKDPELLQELLLEAEETGDRDTMTFYEKLIHG
ncbi:hypothetical protein C0Q70_20539 [Pomacea canaliculata]|uniref:Tetratricopeptide repeat protein 37 n=1 Tax=Pomacea canaliculata TaxID=400727 RepID=A0A2T7NFW0_POMCA|nr:hypothetical protein C0Q70_20539 [Pomacea canaliculata]